jgi:GTPase
MVEREVSTYRLVDTAGLRRKSLIDEDVEYYGFVRAMRAIDRAHVALLVIDATIGHRPGPAHRTLRRERGCAMIILLNKWDALEDEEAEGAVIERVAEQLGFVGFAPVLRISALTGRNVHRIWDAVEDRLRELHPEITTSALNKLLTEMRDFGHTVNKGGKTLRVTT